MRIVIITGISGSGKSIGLNALEDAGYFCVDNLPPTLLRSLVATRLSEDAGMDRLAVAMDARSASSLAGLPADIQILKDEGHDVKVLFLTAKTESLVARFSETRRSHPLSHRMRSDQSPTDRPTLLDCIQSERETGSKLRAWIKELVETEATPLTLLFESFAFKFGVPLDADLVFDVRVLPNPFYDIALRPLTGKDEPVRNYLRSQPKVEELITDIRTYVEKWLPSFKRDNRSYLTVAIGCTGGQHRSVYVVEQLASYFLDSERVVIRHRELAHS
jgi:UPF0042 nucleotide-binding protein